MQIVSLAIADIKLLTTRRFGDTRGFFTETYNARTFAEVGITDHFIQDNHSLSAEVGTLRGLHFQKPPAAQVKLVRVARGRILDVVVDLRRASPTYGQHVTAELSADNGTQMYVPAGFAHGFVTLEPNTEVLYKVNTYYSPTHDAGVLWSDPELGIEWPLPPGGPQLSKKDVVLPLFRELGPIF
jgi:dTDP-4-dehydrorhamnose 3,5-epimerase